MHEMKTLPLYYGKCPACGDFQENCGQSDLIQLINQMVTGKIELAENKCLIVLFELKPSYKTI